MQAQGFEKDKNYFSFSYGFRAFYTALFSSFEESLKKTAGSDISISTSSLGSLSFKYERAITNKIGFGLSVNYLSNSIKFSESGLGTKANVTGNYTLTRNTISILARLNLHFIEGSKFDPGVLAQVIELLHGIRNQLIVPQVIIVVIKILYQQEGHSHLDLKQYFELDTF